LAHSFTIILLNSYTILNPVIPMKLLLKINSNNALIYCKLFLFICTSAFFFSIFSSTFAEANLQPCNNCKVTVAGLIPTEKTDVDVFLGEYGRETLTYMVSSSKTEPWGMRLSPKTISISSLFLNSRSIRKKNPNINTSNFIFSPETANHLRA
jgi:hypothetical protein